MNPALRPKWMHFCQLRNGGDRRAKRKKTGSRAKENSRKGIEIFLSVKRLLTGRANDRCTGRTNSARRSPHRTKNFSECTRTKSDHLNMLHLDGHKFLFFGIFSHLSLIFARSSGFGQSRDFSSSTLFFSSSRCFLKRLCIALIWCWLVLSLSLGCFSSSTRKIYSIIRQASQSGSYWNSSFYPRKTRLMISQDDFSFSCCSSSPITINNHLAQGTTRRRISVSNISLFLGWFFSFCERLLVLIAVSETTMMLFYCQNYCRHIDLNCSIMINNYTREMRIYISRASRWSVHMSAEIWIVEKQLHSW